MDNYLWSVIEKAQKKACEQTPCDVDTYILHILGHVKGEGKYAKLDDESLKLIKNSKTLENFKVNVINLKKYIDGLDDESIEGFINMVSNLIGNNGSPVSVDNKLPESVINPGAPSPQTVKAGGFSHRSRKKVRNRSSKSKIRRKILKSRRVMQRGGAFSLDNNDSIDSLPLIGKISEMSEEELKDVDPDTGEYLNVIPFPETKEEYDSDLRRQIVKVYPIKQYYRREGLMRWIRANLMRYQQNPSFGIPKDPETRQPIGHVKIVPFECIDSGNKEVIEGGKCIEDNWQTIYAYDPNSGVWSFASAEAAPLVPSLPRPRTPAPSGMRRSNALRPTSRPSPGASPIRISRRQQFGRFYRNITYGIVVGALVLCIYFCFPAIMDPSSIFDLSTLINRLLSMFSFKRIMMIIGVLILAKLSVDVNDHLTSPMLNDGFGGGGVIDTKILKEITDISKIIVSEANKIVDILYNFKKKGGRSKRTKKRRRIMNNKKRTKNKKKRSNKNNIKLLK